MEVDAGGQPEASFSVGRRRTFGMKFRAGLLLLGGKLVRQVSVIRNKTPVINRKHGAWHLGEN